MQVIQEASEKGLVKLPEKSFQRSPNTNDAPEGWPAYCFFIGWLITLLCIAGRAFVLRFSNLIVLRFSNLICHRWDGSCCSLWNQLWEPTDLPVVDRHDGELLLEPLRRAADQSGNCHRRDCLHQEETKVESGYFVLKSNRITTIFSLRIMLMLMRSCQ